MILEFIILLLFVYCCVMSYFCYKFARMLLSLEDIIEDSLSDLESIEAEFEELLKKPIFFDSIEIRKCVDLIKSSKALISQIIVDISNFSNNELIEERTANDIDSPTIPVNSTTSLGEEIER